MIIKGSNNRKKVRGGKDKKKWEGKGGIKIEPNKVRPAIIINMIVTKRDEGAFTKEDVECFLKSYVDYMDLKEFDSHGECYRAENGNEDHWGVTRSDLV